MNDFKIINISKEKIKSYTDTLANLRFQAFKEYPYLYEGNHESETSFKEEKSTLTEKLAHVSHERTELDKKLSLLQSSFEDAQNIRRKAIVKGQFKQLQNKLSTVEPI